MTKKIAKIRGTYTLEKDVIERLIKVCNILKVSKSAFINDCLKEHLEVYETLFPNGVSEDFTISDTFKYLGKKFQEMEADLENENISSQ